jgi:drug/metabolite transporter (DMT)-like permease
MPEVIKREVPSSLVILSFATVYLVWGSTYFFIMIALKGFPPMFLGAFRFIIAGMIMLIWSLFKGESIFDKMAIKHSSISGVLMLFGGTGAVIWVEQYVSSGLVAIIVSAAPIWFVLLDKPMWKENFKNKSVISGLIFGFLGVILLFSDRFGNSNTEHSGMNEFVSMIVIIFGSLCWVSGSLYSKYKASSGSNTVNVGWQMFSAGIFFSLFSIAMGEIKIMNWDTLSIKAFSSMLYLILFGSIAAYTAYVWLLNVRPSTQVSTYAYVNPVVAIILGVFFANEKTTIIQITGLLIILGSVLLINLAKYRAGKKVIVN